MHNADISVTRASKYKYSF